MRREVERLAERFMPADALRQYEGQLMLEMIYHIEEALGEKGPAFRDEAFALLREIEVRAAQGKEVYLYVRNVLSRLKKRGLKIGVMTRNCAEALRRVFPDMDAYVDVSLTREDIRVVKPHPSHPLAVVGLLGVDPSEALLVGDHPTDILAGQASGIRTVAVLTGRTQRADFERVGADHIVPDIRGLLAIVDGEHF
jgi:phosphoglycolate phosphatase